MRKKGAGLVRLEYEMSACRGKEKFSRATANTVARKSNKVVLTAYACRCCGHWHVGAAIKKRKPKVQEVGE